jgi:hypothetical protein
MDLQDSGNWVDALCIFHLPINEDFSAPAIAVIDDSIRDATRAIFETRVIRDTFIKIRLLYEILPAALSRGAYAVNWDAGQVPKLLCVFHFIEHEGVLLGIHSLHLFNDHLELDSAGANLLGVGLLPCCRAG